MEDLPESLVKQVVENVQKRRLKNFNPKDKPIRLVYKCDCGYTFNEYHRNQILKHFNSKKHSTDPDRDQMYDYFVKTLDYMAENRQFAIPGASVEDIKIFKKDDFEKHDGKFIYIETKP